MGKITIFNGKIRIDNGAIHLDGCDGIESNDNFGGTGCNSGSLNDIQYCCRWTAGTSDGSTTHSGSDINLSLSANTGTKQQFIYNNAEAPGDFTAQIDIDWTDLDVSLDDNEYVQAYIIAIGPSDAYAVIVGKWAPNDSYPSGSGGTAYDFQSAGAGDSNGAAATAGSDTLKLVRSSGTLTGYYNAVSFNFGTVTGDIEIAYRIIQFGGGTKPAIDADFDNFIFEDGASAEFSVCP